MEFSTSDPNISLKETYIRAHSLTVGTSLTYDYATNANFYWEIIIFPGTRFSFCEKKLKDLNIKSKPRTYDKEYEIIYRYARGKLIVFN